MTPPCYSGYRFPSDVIQRAVWMYLRFTLSYHDIEDLLAERGIEVTYETIRRWVNAFGPMIAGASARNGQRRTGAGTSTRCSSDRRQVDVSLAGRRCRR
jgi:transposase-like protein